MRMAKKNRVQNLRKKMLLRLCLTAVFLVLVTVTGMLLREAGMATQLGQKNQPPGLLHPFGTDMLGRDMFCRTLAGLSLSIRFGVCAALVCAVLAGFLGVFAAVGGPLADRVITWFLDLCMGVPHMLLLLLISFACGKGFWGVAAGIVLTHWMSLARLLRAEVIRLKAEPYVRIARQFGRSRGQIAREHMCPHLLPQFLTGLVTLFPHAILHESGITFLGFGLGQEEPAIGIILSESMRYLVTGKWWLAVFPGAGLLLVTLLFFRLGDGLQQLLDPSSAQL